MSSSRPAAIDTTAARLVSAFECAANLTVLPFLRAERSALLEREVAAPLRAAIGEAIAGIAELERALDDRGGAAWDDAEPVQADVTQPIGRMLSDELWQQVSDLCFAARGELRRAERSIQPLAQPMAQAVAQPMAQPASQLLAQPATQLPAQLGQLLAHAVTQPLAAQPAARADNHRRVSHEDQLAACEGAQRKLRRALGAVLGALGRACDRGFPALAELDAEFEAAAAVRRMYAKFRRSLPACDAADPASVRRALRYSAVSIAVMIGGNEFADVRTQDRALLLALQARILRWARDGAPEADGVRLHRDLVTSADLLRAINLRQELAEHDQRMLRDAIDALAAPDPAAALAAAAPALRSLDGRDDAIDALALRALREPPSRALVAELRLALAPPAADRAVESLE